MTHETTATQAQDDAPPAPAAHAGIAMKLIEAEATLAVHIAGADPALIPTLTEAIGWRQVDDDIALFTAMGEGRDGVRLALATLTEKNAPEKSAPEKSEPEKSAPEKSNGDAPAMVDHEGVAPKTSKAGSGAQSRPSGVIRAIDASDPLALGHELHAIASGQMRVRF